MLGLAELVNDALIRHGVETRLDPSRLRWSPWFSCSDTLQVRIPSKPGLFALGEEVAALPKASEAGEGDSASSGHETLALFRISETNDLAMALDRLGLPGHPESKCIAKRACFARYAVIEDPAQRQTAFQILEQGMGASREAVRTVSGSLELEPGGSMAGQNPRSLPLPVPSGF